MIKPVTGYLLLDLLIVLIIGFLAYCGFFTPTRATTKQFSGGVLVYRDLVLKNRNDLTEKFSEVKEDLLDCLIDFPGMPKFPMAVLF